MKKTKHNAAICLFFAVTGIIFYSCSGDSSNTWFVEAKFEKAWEQILANANPPSGFVEEIQAWDGGDLPEGQGILIASKPWKTQERISVYRYLPYELEHNGALLLALNPWMVFYKYRDPPLTAERAYSLAGGDGTLLLPGQDSSSVDAWIARMLQTSPGVFSADENSWLALKNNLFSGSRFPNGSQTYTWQDVFFRLMGNETAWVYAPLNIIRSYPNPRKSILTVLPFPEHAPDGQYSLQAQLLWALPINSGEANEKIQIVMKWLKDPKTQTIIANAIEWMPADPYGIPYDPVSLASHRNWITATWVYEVE
ncbi:MAG: hypothetical protein FWH41_05320 [Treponema sp.]|nr:hypothetical protein [Treponema sp.]